MDPKASPRSLPLLIALVLIAQLALVAAPAQVDDTGPDGPDRTLPTGIRGFLENGGQVDPAVEYYAWNNGGGVALGTDGAFVTLVDGERGLGTSVRVAFVGAREASPEGREALPGITSFIRGDDPATWRTGLLTYRQVVYRELWQGIDLVYRVEGGSVKYDLVLAPGSDPGDVAFRLSGHRGVTVDGRGDLVVSTDAGLWRDAGLVAYYGDEPSSRVDCRFVLLDGDTYGFRLGDVDRSRPVVIDPLVYSTFVGGGAGEVEEPTAGVEVDASGRALLAGQAETTDFPVTTGAFQTSNAGGGTDLFCLRLSADGSDVEWATYVGGTGAEYPYDLALDASGRPVVVGRTNSTDLPTVPGSLNTTHTGDDHEGFFLKLNAQGTSLVLSSYLGGNNTDEVVAVAVDASGDLVLAGNTLSPDLPVTAGVAFPNHTGLTFDAFVARVSGDGSTLEALTYLGGTKWDVVLAIDVDDAGAVYLGGETISTDFPSTNGSFQEQLANNLTRDGFIAKLAANLTNVTWATYMGDMFDDFVEFVQVADDGSVYAAGDTDSGGFPVTNGSFQEVHQGATDAFILHLAANGSQLEYSTLFGGTDEDYCEGLHVDGDGVVTIVGSTSSPDLPTILGVQQEDKAGKFDAFLFRLDADGSTPLYCTYLGGTEWDLANGLDVDDDGDVYIAAATDSTDFPTTSGAFQETHGGQVDVTVTKLDLFLDREPPVARPGTDMIIEQHDTVDFDGSASSDNVGVVNWTWELTYDDVDRVIYGPTFSWTFDLAGKYYIYLTVRDAVNLTDRQWVSVYVNDTEAPVAIAPADVQGQQHWTVTLDGGASHDNVGVEVYTWTFAYGDDNETLTGRKVDFTFDLAGVFEITLTVVDAHGNTASDTLTVTIMDITPPDLVLVQEDIEVDQHARVRFDASPSTDNVRITNITWQFVYAGSPIVLYGHTPDFTFDRAGRYTVTIMAEDANGNRAFGEAGVTVADTEHPVAVAGSDVTIDQGEVVDLDASGSTDNVGIVDWLWSVDVGGEISNFSGIRNAFTFNAAGTFSVALTVVDAAGNTATDSFTVHVRDITPPVAVAGESMFIAQGDEVTFDGGASSDNVGVTSWNWLLVRGTDIGPFTGPSFSHVFDTVGTYTVKLQVFDASGLSATDEITVVVLDTEAPSAEAGPDVEVDLDTTVHLNGSASADNVGIVDWTWTFNYNQEEKELTGPDASFAFELQGTYLITLTVTDEAGNAASDTVNVTVVSDETIGGGGDGPGGVNFLIWIAILVVVLVIVAALVLAARRGRGGDGEADDMGWAPTEDEIKARDTSTTEGAQEGHGSRRPGAPGDK
jgi:PKD repeat protein